jgi:hypothetical protein
VVTVLVVFVLGFITGGYLFSETQPRSILSVTSCDRCLSRTELQGLIASVVINRTPALMDPIVVLETDKTVAIRNPEPERSIDYLVLPKKGLKDVGDLSDGDSAFLTDAYAVMERLIEKDHLINYEIVTYGPGLQRARYLHFHLRSQS